MATCLSAGDWHLGLSAGDRKYPLLTGRSGTWRARRPHPHLGVLVLVVVTARTVQGMARVRSGQAPAWPLVSGRSARSGLRGQA